MAAEFSFNKHYWHDIASVPLFDITIKHKSGLINVGNIEIDKSKLEVEMLEDVKEVFSIRYHKGGIRVIAATVNNSNILVEAITDFEDAESVKNYREFLTKVRGHPLIP